MKKFLSLILALTLVASLFTVNVMAASKAHTITLSADKTTELKAGDTVTVTVAIDNTDNIVSCGYVLSYDTDVFSIDTTKSKGLEKYIDSAWYNEIKVADWEAWWGYYLGTPVKNANTTDGTINFKWAGTYGIGAEEDGDEHGEDNRVIGKFILTVKEDAPDGECEFVLTGSTGDAGENSAADMVCAPITVTVGSSAPAVVTPDVAAGEEVGTGYDNAFAVKTDITPGSATEIGVLFAPDFWLGTKTLDLNLEGAAKASMAATGEGTVTLKAAIRDIPWALKGEAFKMVTRAYATGELVTQYADVVETDYTAFAE